MMPALSARTRRCASLRPVLGICLLATIAVAVLGCSDDIVPPLAQAADPPAKPPHKPVDLRDSPFPQRIKVPDFDGGTEWINTAGPLSLEQLRGKFVLVDFWTYCCINCMHILPELKKLEHRYPRDLVVIGVHSAKFETEADSKNITEAVLRYEIEHPVVNDAKHIIWNRFGVNSWPTIILIDPEGYAIWGRSGEVTFDMLDAIVKRAVVYYKRKGLVDESPLKFDVAAANATPTPLRYPGKVLADEPGDRLFIADSNHNRIVIAGLDGKLREVIGNGEIGMKDGDYTHATFNHPQGMALHGHSLYVADTENHSLRKVDLNSKTVATIAGQGHQSHSPWPGIDEHHPVGSAPKRPVAKPRNVALNSPWDLLVHDKYLYIAMAGPHQIWRMTLDESEIGPYAGNGREDIVDGPLLPPVPYEEGFASFAQPSGLSTDGHELFVADSEGSSIRAVPFESSGKVKTILGTAGLHEARLFTFGDIDGPGDLARLQHALGVAWTEGKLYVADTYNNKIKVIDITKDTCTTIAGNGKEGHDDAPAESAKSATFDEPAGISAAGGKLYVADTNNHLIRVIDLHRGNAVSTFTISGLEPPKPAEAAHTASTAGPPPTAVAPISLRSVDGAVTLGVKIELPEGWKINAIAPMRYQVAAAGKQGPLDQKSLGKSVKLDHPSQQFEIRLPTTSTSGTEQLTVSVQYYYCQEGREGLCKASAATWQVPLTIAADAPTSADPLVAKAE